MSESPYDWTNEEIAAALAAYKAAPDDATKEELRTAMDSARARVAAESGE